MYLRSKKFMYSQASGQTILEVLVALSAAIIILSAITVIVLTSLNQSVASQNQSTATQYAQEGLESVKLGVAVPVNNTYDLPISGVPNASDCLAPNIGSYRRCLRIETDTTACGTLRKVTVSVSWTDGKCANQSYCHTVPITTCL